MYTSLRQCTRPLEHSSTFSLLPYAKSKNHSHQDTRAHRHHGPHHGVGADTAPPEAPLLCRGEHQGGAAHRYEDVLRARARRRESLAVALM